MVEALLRAGHCRALLRTDVIIVDGQYRGRTGWISGDITTRHPLATKALVHFSGGAVELVKLAHLRWPQQLDLFAETKTPPAQGCRRRCEQDASDGS